MSSADPHQPAGPQAPDAPVQSGAAPQIDNARRRFVGKGLAVPAVLTVASAPVMANGFTCFTASAQMSMNASGIARRARAGSPSQFTCNGRAPSVWAAGVRTSDFWPASHPPTTKFSAVFTQLPPGITGDTTLAEVLQMQNQAAAQAFVATHLNITRGFVATPVLGGTSLQQLWASVNSNQGFVPFIGATPWSPSKVVVWLSSSWGVALPTNFATLA